MSAHPETKFTWRHGHLDARLNVQHWSGRVSGLEQAVALLRKHAGDAFARDEIDKAFAFKLAAQLVETEAAGVRKELEKLQTELKEWEAKEKG